MDIRTFVSEMLTQIVEGVADAQRRVDEGGSGAKLNPRQTHSANIERGLHEARPVEFDIAVTVANEDREGSESKVGGGLQVLSVVGVKLGAAMAEQSSGSQRSETVSRVQFSVLLAQPGHTNVERPTPIPRTNTAWAL
jgi:hypothetical protein